MISKEFLKKHCPCFQQPDCKNRSDTCHSQCKAWKEYSRLADEERKREKLRRTVDGYTGEKTAEKNEKNVRYRMRRGEK